MLGILPSKHHPSAKTLLRMAHRSIVGRSIGNTKQNHCSPLLPNQQAAACFENLSTRWGGSRSYSRTTCTRVHSSSSSSPEEIPGHWAETYKAQTNEELKEAYSNWSPTYDVDSLETFGYMAPLRASEELDHILRVQMVKVGSTLMGDHTEERIKIVDVGAGTGLVGEYLHYFAGNKETFEITGIDFSPEMLEIASKKNIYKKLHCVDFCNSDLRKDDTIIGDDYGRFDAAISVGTFTPKHIDGTMNDMDVGLENLIHLVRNPGGIICLTLREDFLQDESNGLQQKLKELQETGKLKLLNVTDPELYTWKVSDRIMFRCWTFMVMS